MTNRTSYLLTDLIGGKRCAPDKRLHDLAHKVQRLAPDYRDPERYHVEKSEIVAALKTIAKEVRGNG